MITTFKEWTLVNENKLDEALTLSQYRPYVNIKPFPKFEKMLDSIFGDKQRLTVMPNTSVVIEKGKWEKDVESFMDSIGYDVIDYIGNSCVKKSDSKNIFKISKILNKENPKLYKMFIEDPTRMAKDVGQDYKIIFSRHPYDIVGSSTGRNWDSCLSLGGDECHKLKDEIKAGSFVAYGVRMNDDNIQSPLCRVMIRRFENKEEERDYYVASSIIYGNPPKDFYKQVDEFVYSKQRKPIDGHYTVNTFSHPDKNWAVVVQNGKVFKV